MDRNQIPSSLRGAFPISDSSLSDLLADIRTPGNSLLPAVMLIVPQHYKDRSGQRVDICGTVSENTVEYINGFRFFDINGTFFNAEGHRFENKDHVDDLCSTIPPTDVVEEDAPISPYVWVHPQHNVIKTFFSEIVPNQTVIAVSRHYLNRMGFVVEITTQHDSGSSQPPLFEDADGRLYSSIGTLVNNQALTGDDDAVATASSMFDLAYEIKNWSIFIKQDWSKDRLSAFHKNDDVPELFNPVSENRHAMMSELLTIILRAQELARQMNIEVGFHINSEGMQ